MRFPRWRVLRRALNEAEHDASAPWGAVLVALAFAFVGAFFVLPKGANWGARFVSGVGVAALAVVGIWGLLIATRAVAYRIRKFRDPVWEVAWNLRSEEHGGIRTSSRTVGLVCHSAPPVNVGVLNHVEAFVRFPDGDYIKMASEGFGGGPHDLWFFAARTLHSPLAPGTYEVRWYGTTARRKRYEITRSKFTVPDE